MRAVAQRNRFTIFAALALAVAYLFEMSVLQMATPDYRELVASFAAPFDLMVFLPAMFYLLIIRKNGLSPLFVLPVIWLGNGIVMAIAQPKDLTLVGCLTVLLVAAEVALVVFEAIRTARVFRSARSESPDPAKWFPAVFYHLTKNKRVSHLAGMELTTMYYAFFSWRAKPLAVSDGQAFSYHKASGYLAFMGVLMGVACIELVAVHLLLMQWSVVAATVMSVLSLYAMIWMVGIMRAVVLRPVVVGSDGILVNFGFHTSFPVGFNQIEGVVASDPSVPKDETMDLSTMGSPNSWIVLKDAIEVETMFGRKRRVCSVRLTLDDPQEFRAAVQRHLDQAKAGACA